MADHPIVPRILALSLADARDANNNLQQALIGAQVICEQSAAPELCHYLEMLHASAEGIAASLKRMEGLMLANVEDRRKESRT